MEKPLTLTVTDEGITASWEPLQIERKHIKALKEWIDFQEKVMAVEEKKLKKQ